MAENKTNINWYPGHMTKTKRMIVNCLPLVDVVVELVDARIPLSSKNPDITKLCENKPKMILLNKSDLADPAQNQKWLAYYQKNGYHALLFDSKNKKGASVQKLAEQIRQSMSEKIERNMQRGMSGRAVKIMVLGIPNVGKSTWINCMSGANRVKAEDRPGVTRGKQWISLQNGIDLLDMPGILWPKIEDPDVALKLALTGAIKDTVLDTEELAVELLGILRQNYTQKLQERYKLPQQLPEDLYDLLYLIGRKRGFMVSGGEIDTERAANILIDEYRAGKIGALTLDEIPQLL